MTNSSITIADGKPGGPGNRHRLAFDNLIRRELKVGDPNDADQIARALLDRYQGDTRAQAISGEAQGLPFLNTPLLTGQVAAASTATNLDLDQARDDVEQDLRELMSSNLTKDVRPELEGWQQSLHVLMDEGTAAARQGLDPYSRDRAFAMRRQLGEYARLARLIGALTPELNENYRNLAQSIDEVCAVLLVLMGEALANVGFAGGRYLLQVPYSELQARRDRVLVALRNLSGSAQESLDQGVYPRGLAAYRELYSEFARRGQAELRSLLNEGELSRAMDELIHLSGGGSTLGMRRVGATAWSSLSRFSRFVQVTLRAIELDAPPLIAFQSALQLFVDGFASSGGFRLLRIARPGVLMSGLYGAADLDKAERRLIELVQRRGELASTADCLTRCGCDEGTALEQIVLDRILYDVDRAIDLYAAGKDDFGPPEQRAAAHGKLIEAYLAPEHWDYKHHEDRKLPPKDRKLPPTPLDPEVFEPIESALKGIAKLLLPNDNKRWEKTSRDALPQLTVIRDTPHPVAEVLRDELVLQLHADREWRPIVAQMSSGCIGVHRVFGETLQVRKEGSGPFINNVSSFGRLMAVQLGALLMVENLAPCIPWKRDGGVYLPITPDLPNPIDRSLEGVERNTHKPVAAARTSGDGQVEDSTADTRRLTVSDKAQAADSSSDDSGSVQ